MSGIAQAVSNLEAWLESMRCPEGYGGPVVHWWQNCLSYTGPGLDWRYEGIISGYLLLWQRTGEARWLVKACRAGDDLVRGQLPSGNFRNSCFEMNPYSGGTPHEAAASLGLLRLAKVLKELTPAASEDIFHSSNPGDIYGGEATHSGSYDWERYFEAAERNLRDYFIDRLWDQEAASFRDHPDAPSLVPNKACTIVEALFAMSEVSQDEEYIDRYALPTLQDVITLQVTRPGRLHGAIAQDRQRDRVTGKYFPYYIARCIPALVHAYRFNGDQHWLEAAGSALEFIARQAGEDGYLPQVLYERGANPYPQWVAGLGDVLRCADLMSPYGMAFNKSAVQSALLAGQLPNGGIVTGGCFAAQVSQHSNGAKADFRDYMPVAGWCDKAFHYLASILPAGEPLPQAEVADFHSPCRIRGQRAAWQETATEMSLMDDQGQIYHWRKGEAWADIVRPEAMWK